LHDAARGEWTRSHYLNEGRDDLKEELSFGADDANISRSGIVRDNHRQARAVRRHRSRCEGLEGSDVGIAVR